MRIFNNILSNLIIDFNNKKLLLGRWNITYCNYKINKIIDLSNEDHCGPCGNNIKIGSIREKNVSNIMKNIQYIKK
jgi:hypothetical protein